jgi:hypothetical protein
MPRHLPFPDSPLFPLRRLPFVSTVGCANSTGFPGVLRVAPHDFSDVAILAYASSAGFPRKGTFYSPPRGMPEMPTILLCH